jgi:hypothetical protein
MAILPQAIAAHNSGGKVIAHAWRPTSGRWIRAFSFPGPMGLAAEWQHGDRPEW